jgi:glycine betaine/proline transport system ATP-binding protein
MDAKNDSIIRVEDVSKVFGRAIPQALAARREGKSKAEIEATTGTTIGVVDASFEVKRGEIFVIIGLSGSGKSTLLRCINWLIEPTAGEVYIDGEPLSRTPIKALREVRRKKIAMVFQHFGLMPNRSVLDNVAFGLEVQGVPAERRRERGEEMLRVVGLEGQGLKAVTELSGGMRQRVGLARALATKPDVLLMDEPFGALDPLIRRDMQNFLLDLQAELNRTIVFVTHDIDEALMLGHRVAIMKDGEIVQLGLPEEILARPATGYVKKFVADVDRAKVRTAESIMVPAREIAYESEGPHVVLRRMRGVGLSTIFVVDEERRLVGLADVDAIAQLAEQNDAEIRGVVNAETPRVGKHAFLRDIVPLLVDGNAPVAVVDERDKLAGVITRGALMGGLAARERTEKEEEEETYL